MSRETLRPRLKLTPDEMAAFREMAQEEHRSEQEHATYLVTRAVRRYKAEQQQVPTRPRSPSM